MKLGREEVLMARYLNVRGLIWLNAPRGGVKIIYEVTPSFINFSFITDGLTKAKQNILTHVKRSDVIFVPSKSNVSQVTIYILRKCCERLHKTCNRTKAPFIRETHSTSYVFRSWKMRIVNELSLIGESVCWSEIQGILPGEHFWTGWRRHLMTLLFTGCRSS